MRFWCALGFLGLASASFAQHRAYLEIGGLFPTYRGSDFGKDLGPSIGAGYAFWRRGYFSVSGELRAAYHDVTVGGGASLGFEPGSGPDDNPMALYSGTVVLRHRHPGTQFFTGIGLGVGRADIQDHGSKTDALISLEAGYNFTKVVYVSARYQHSGQDALRGANLSLGFRL